MTGIFPSSAKCLPAAKSERPPLPVVEGKFLVPTKAEPDTEGEEESHEEDNFVERFGEHIYIYIYVCVCVYRYMCVCVCVCIFICIYTYIYICIYIYVCVCTYIYIALSGLT